MDPSQEVCKSLLKWFQTLRLDRARSVTEINDGVAILDVLIRISPQHFEELLPKIKADVVLYSVVKESNLKKINESILDYYQNVLNSQVLDVGKPNVTTLAKTGDLIELGKLLRLVLGCAINCERHQEYITQIMSLEQSVQQCIMSAIQQLEDITGGQGRSGISLLGCLDTDSRVLRLVKDLDATNEAKGMLAQQVQYLEQQVQLLQEEKQVLLSENHLLATQLNDRQELDMTRSPTRRRQVEELKDELFKVETLRDDYRAKTLEQEKQIVLLQEKVADLLVANEATNRLKDEVDALSESADKVQKLETTLASYKKKLEGYADMKKQFKVLEEQNFQYLHANLKYEEELKMHNVWKSQVELYKNRAAELQNKLDEQTLERDEVIFTNQTLEKKLITALAEKERIAKERDSLRDENEDLKIGGPKKEKGAPVAQELIPFEMQERFKALHNATANNHDALPKQAMLDEALDRVDTLTETNKSCRNRILELQAQLDAQQEKERTIQETLAAKDNELQLLQAKHKRSLEKAREVAVNLDLQSNGSIESIRSKNMKEIEEKLITSAFYRLSSTCHREAVDERLALLSAGQGQSFLSRQRQPTPRKQVIPFKSK